MKKSNCTSTQTPKSPKLSRENRELAYYWKGIFECYKRLQFRVASMDNPYIEHNHKSDYRDGYYEAVINLKDLEHFVYNQLLMIYAPSELLRFRLYDELPGDEEEEGENDEQGEHPTETVNLNGYILYKLGEGLWTLRKGEEH